MVPRSLIASVVLSVLLPGCVSYRAAPVSTPLLASSAPCPPAGPLAFEAAVRWAVAHNPDLLALRARAAAVNVDPGPEPIDATAGTDSDGRLEVDVALDALSLLGLGTRKADRALARSRRSEAWLRHHERAREIAAEVAAAYAVARALEDLAEPVRPVDADAYVKAGIEPGLARDSVESVKAVWGAEKARREAQRRTNRADLLRLLGARPDASVEMSLPAPEWPVVPAATPATVLAARADLQRKIAEYEVADAEFRRAVAAQFPGLVIAPAVALDPTTWFGAVSVKLPVGAPREARAAEHAREAARHETAGAVLDALRDASNAREEATVAEISLSATRKWFQTTLDAFRAAKARLEATTGTFSDAMGSAAFTVDAAVMLREATVEAARARVAAARASGWPGPETVR